MVDIPDIPIFWSCGVSCGSAIVGPLFRGGQLPFHRRVDLKSIAFVWGPASETCSSSLLEQFRKDLHGSFFLRCVPFFWKQS